jgi:outer membrane protein TolC
MDRAMLPRLAIAGVCLAAILVAGCGPKFYTEQADKDVYKIVSDKNTQAFGRAPAFTIQQTATVQDLLSQIEEREKRNPPPPPTLPTLPAVPLEPVPAPDAESPAAPAAGSKDAGATASGPKDASKPAPGAMGGATPAPDAKPPAAPAAGSIDVGAKDAGAKPVPAPSAGPALAPASGTAPAAGPGTPGEALPSPVPEPGPGTVRLTMADALRVAVRGSRDHQSQKETVYLAGLTLTFSRYLFQPHPFATGKVDFNSTGSTGERQKTWDGQSEVGVSQQLADGAVIAGNLGLTALKFISPKLGDTVDSSLNFSLSQPLWRGFGRQIVQENLIQAERNALYAVRTFAKFEQDFAVNIASQYLQVLQQRDVVMNGWVNYLSLKDGRERADWLAKAERLPEFQVDQARQDELRAYNSWIVERTNYVNALDAFKISLGIPMETEIALEPRELDRLAALGLQQSDVRLEDATAKALKTRLDLANTRDGLDDAGRKVLVAEDGLKGDVDLVASAAYKSLDTSPQSARLTLRRGDYSIGLDLDLPIDRLKERNALRQTQISRELAARTLSLQEDNITLAVRQSFRQLAQARESYEIQKRAVALAERRVESTQLLLQAGRATQRDVLDSQSSLLEAKNALMQALVAHTIAGLDFQRDVGTLVVDEEGQIHGWNLTDSGR